MKFTLSTKPLADALNLGVINANISRFYQKSGIAELTATKNTLQVNLEAASIATELLLKGSGDTDSTEVVFVDCSMLKSIVNTFESNTIVIEFVDGGIVLHSNGSKFTLPKVLDASVEGASVGLARPALAEPGSTSVSIVQSDWKFISDYQMYSIANSFAHPVYTKVWVSQAGDVIVGDYDSSIFTFSKKSKLGKTCLLSDTIINLFCSLPDGASITPVGNSYRIDLKTDAFEYATEFTPKYESDPDVGSYSSEAILQSAQKDDNNKLNVPAEPVKKFMAQSSILASSGDSSVYFEFTNGELCIRDSNIDCRIKVEGACCNFTVELPSELFRSILSHLDADVFHVSPLTQDDLVVGICIWTDNITAVLGGVE